MSRRHDLQDLFETIAGQNKVYFQPPESIKLNYPCIVYNLSSDSNRYADNIKFKKYDRYSVTVIDKNPDSTLRDSIRALPYCTFDRSFTSNNLNHYVFSLYY